MVPPFCSFLVLVSLFLIDFLLALESLRYNPKLGFSIGFVPSVLEPPNDGICVRCNTILVK
jgi:hypothetical protein